MSKSSKLIEKIIHESRYGSAVADEVWQLKHSVDTLDSFVSHEDDKVLSAALAAKKHIDSIVVMLTAMKSHDGFIK